ncbi:class I SAM-dependent methyltransferase [bacterium]|jgi:2-polyprenyl-3-methyl-5-hydroxy-6-metoxy-1,4-benzoquinol methylase|nr:class I SAM-dependent methyltransferase [bacterium]
MNFWDERYSGKDFVYGKEPNDFLVAREPLIPRGGKVLCLAEGEGRNSVFLAGKGHSVFAVDQSSVGLEKLQGLARERGVHVQTRCEDLAEFSIPRGEYDAIVSIWCHVPPALRVRLHSDCVRGLKSGGMLILEAYHPKQLDYKTGGPPTAELMMTVVDLNRELSGLIPLLAREVDREVHEGAHHFGMSAVTQWVGRKP